MKTLLLLALAFGVAVTSCNAQTITACGISITASGTYTVSADLTSTSGTTPCITVTATTGAGVIINGNSHTLSNSYSSPATLIQVINSTVPVSWNHLTLSLTTYSMLAYINNNVVSGSFGINTISSNNNTYVNGLVQVTSTMYMSSFVDHFTSAVLQYNSCSYCAVISDVLDLSGVTSTIAAAIVVVDGANQYIHSNTITGNSTYVDDGIVLQGANLRGTQVQSNTISNVYDAAIEISGRLNGGYIENNITSNIGQVMVGGWLAYNSTPLQITGTTINHNTLSGGSGDLFRFTPPTNNTGQFIDNTITNNTASGASGTTPVDNFGDPSVAFASSVGNYIYNNDFTAGSALSNVQFYPSAGYTDGGLNKCNSVLPSAGVPITCH